MQRKFNHLLILLFWIGVLQFNTAAYSQDIPPFIGEGPTTLIDSVSTNYELPFCANESFQVPLPGGICVEGTFETDPPDLVLIENLGADGFKFTPLADATVQYTSDSRVCEDGTVIDSETYTYRFFPNPICTSPPVSNEYLHVNSFCEGDTPFFFPDPPRLKIPCIQEDCSIVLVSVFGSWEPVDEGEPFPPLQTTEYIIRYFLPPCPAPGCELLPGTPEYTTFNEALTAYSEGLAKYEGKLGLIEINNCLEEIDPEDADTIITICKGESVLLEGWRNVIECPCGGPLVGPADCFPFAQPGGTWAANGTLICEDCITTTVTPERTTLYAQKTPPYLCPLPTPIGGGPIGPAPPQFSEGPKLTVLVQVVEDCGITNNSIGQNRPSCSAYSGTIIFDKCDDGRAFVFAQTPDGEILDIYFEEGLSFDYYEGQPIQFDYKAANFPAPCSVADKAVVLTCIEEIDPSCSLANLIDLSDNLCERCISEIAIYAYQGETYIASIADNTNCRDGLTTVENCNTGEIFCMNGGIAGFNQCEDFFKNGLKLETLIKEDCKGCICPAIFAPVCGADGKTYGNECEAACEGVEVVGAGACKASETTCNITISNTVCRRVGVFDTKGNLLTIMNAGPFGNAPVGTPIPTWTDPTPLEEGKERIYVLKEENFELGRAVATCASPEINTKNSYASGCNDGLSIGNYTNIGCREVEIHRTNGDIIAILAPQESIELTSTNNIYIFIAERDTVAIKSDADGAIDSKGCEEGCFCITLFDPVCGVDGQTYGNACEAACEGVEVAFRGMCTDALAPPCEDVGGVDFGLCEAIMGVAVVNGTCTFVSGCGNYVVDGIDYTQAFFPSVEICAQSCNTVDPIFTDYPWLSDLVDPNKCTDEKISVYSFSQFSFVYLETANTKKLYFQDGAFFCESFSNYDCLEEFGLSNLTASWSCPKEDCICTLEYAPVCGVDGKTYGNACAAACEGVEVAFLGECTSTCICPKIFAPVCGIDGITYGNACEAACVGVEVAAAGECMNSGQCDLLARILLPNTLCGTCISEIAIYEFQGQNYLVSLASNTDGQGAACSDGLTTVQSCDSGDNFCLDGGIAGFNQCEKFFEEAIKIDVIMSQDDCEGCLCPAVALPVCGIDGVTYINECRAACAGVEVAFDGMCNAEQAGPCTDLAGVDFGDCRAIMGIGIVNGQCRTVGGCLNFVINGVDYTDAFFPTMEVCMQSCIIPPGDPIFAEFPWLAELVDPTNCKEDQVTVYQSGAYQFLFVENQAGQALYLEDGTFYCQESASYDCRAIYNLTEIVASWSCGGASNTGCNNILEQAWLQPSLDQECTGSIYQIEYNGSPAVYVSTLCECVDDSDMIYTCEGEFICSVAGRIALDSRCQIEVSNQLTDDRKIWSPVCDCDCPVANQTVCGVDGKFYDSACDAACAGVEVSNNLIDCSLTTTLTPPCFDVAGVDFGPCDAVLGVAIVNGACTILSGCNVMLAGLDYTASFFPTVEICQQTCGGSNGSNEIFETYDWLTTLIDPNNCEDEKVTVYQLGIYTFLYVERGTSAELYFEDGTFYCLQSQFLDCRNAYGLREVVATWSCSSSGGNFNGGACDGVLDKPWIKDLQSQSCTGKIYAISYNGESAIYVENRCLCILPDAGNLLYNCEGDIICAAGAFGPIGSGCDSSLGTQLEPSTIIWEPACACDCVGFPVCGVDGNNYSSDCEANCAGVEVAFIGECPPNLGDPLFEDYPWLSDIVNPRTCQNIAISEFNLGSYSFIYIFDSTNRGSLYLDDDTFYCQDSPNYDCLAAYQLTTQQITRTWKCAEGLVYDAEAVATERSKIEETYFLDALAVYPNPTKGLFQIRVNSISKEPQLLTVVDLYGRIIQENTIQSDAPTLTVSVDLADKPDGLYMVVLKARGQVAVRKAVVKSGL